MGFLRFCVITEGTQARGRVGTEPTVPQVLPRTAAEKPCLPHPVLAVLCLGLQELVLVTGPWGQGLQAEVSLQRGTGRLTEAPGDKDTRQRPDSLRSRLVVRKGLENKVLEKRHHRPRAVRGEWTTARDAGRDLGRHLIQSLIFLI